MTLFEKLTQSKEILAEYLLKCCDNPLYECNEDMCDFCNKTDKQQCCDQYCLDAIMTGLDSKIN